MTDTRRKNVILDLDNTLISAEGLEDFPFEDTLMKQKALKFAIHDMDGYYIVFERPYVQDFLDYLFENYDVSIWTAASKDYALFIIKHIILKKHTRHIKYILFAYHCDLSKKFYNGNSKDLRLIWDTLDLEGYSTANTVIIDDLEEVYNTQPRNSIHIPAFEILEDYSDYDKELQHAIKNKIDAVFEGCAK